MQNSKKENFPNENEENWFDRLQTAQKITIHDIVEHITGPVISIAVHIVLLALLGTLIILPRPETDPREMPDVTLTKLPPQVIPPIKIPIPPPTAETPHGKPESPIDSPQHDPQNTPTPNAPSITTTNLPEMPPLLNIKMNDSAKIIANISPAIPGRSKEGIEESIKIYNPPVATEKMIEKSLNWLARNQNPDGSWGQDASKKPALTGLALLAFLGHGETHRSEKYGVTVLKAIKKCTDYAKTMGNGKVIQNSGAGYGHAIIAYALSEAYAMTNIYPLKAVVDKMANSIVNGQNRLGSFNYNFDNTPARKDPKTGKITGGSVIGEPRCDLSIAGWNIQALKAAFIANSDVEGIEEALEKSAKALKKVHSCKTGGFSYGRGNKSNPKETMSAVGTLCLQLLGNGNAREVRKGISYLEKTRKKKNREMNWQLAHPWSLYQWYYQTQVFFQGRQKSPSTWKMWNRSFTKTLKSEQAKDGHWSSPQQKYASGKNKSSHGENMHSVFKSELDLNIYATSLCTMMLEVYYRILPSYKQVAHNNKEEREEEDSDIEKLL